MTYGHRNDPEGFHRCLQEFDAALPETLLAARGRPADPHVGSRLRPDDAVHGPQSRARAPARPRAGRRRGRPADGCVLRRRRDDGGVGWRPRRRSARRAVLAVRAVELIEAKRDGGGTARPSSSARRRLPRRQRRARADERMVHGGSFPRAQRRRDARSAMRWSPPAARSTSAGWPAHRRQALHRRRRRQGHHLAGAARRGVRRAGRRRCPAAASRTPAGTLDKLESIPGFRVGRRRRDDRPGRARRPRRRRPRAADLAPADGAIYALRDVTGRCPRPR